MRPSLRISKTPTAWRWYHEDMDSPPPPWEESGDFPTWQTAEAAARLAHPNVERVWVHAVRDWGVAYEDSLPMVTWP